MTTVMPLLGVTILLAADPADNSLRGTVGDPAGKPIAGARVDIATAAPRFGPGLFCPSCYRDCGKSTRTDERGRFEIGDLDAKFKFTVLVTAPGRTAHHTRLLDPRSGEIKITLEAPADASPERTVLVELVDDGGKPVAGALVEPVGAQTADRRWGGHVDGADPAVSDAAGRATPGQTADRHHRNGAILDRQQHSPVRPRAARPADNRRAGPVRNPPASRSTGGIDGVPIQSKGRPHSTFERRPPDTEPARCSHHPRPGLERGDRGPGYAETTDNKKP